jgi:hypothetical protein
MIAFKYVFALIWIACLAWLVLAYGWAAGLIGYFAATFFGAFVLVEREDEGDV